MRAAAALLLPAAALLAAQPLRAVDTAMPDTAMKGVPDPTRAHVDYMLKCQGCHHPDGSGNAVNTPPLAGEVARFLGVDGGRAFLGRVPGVASTDLDDARLAQLLNWALYHFDRGHLPAGFRPYTPAEIGALRHRPLRLDRLETRAALVARMNSLNQRSKNTGGT